MKESSKTFRSQTLLQIPNSNNPFKKLQLRFIVVIVLLIGRSLFSERYNYL